MCAQLRLAEAEQASLRWRRIEVGILALALIFCAWAARSAAKAAEAAKKEPTTGDRPFAFFIVHALQYDPVAAGGRQALEGRLFRLNYGVKNYGRTPCTIRRIAITFAQGPTLAQARDKVEILSFPSWVIPENGEEGGQVQRQASWSMEGLELYRDGSELLFVSGEIDYEDLGGAQYVRRFCLSKGFDKPASEEGGARANYDRRVYQNARLNVGAPPPPPAQWPPEGIPPPSGKSGARVIPLKK